jgi:predicted nucleic acid-binding Zn ribbon protein
MTTLDCEATFVKLDKLRERMDRLEKTPDTNEWQYTRNLIQALTEGIAKSKNSSVQYSRKVRVDAPAPVNDDWQELVDVLSKKGIKSESRRSAARRK